MTLETLVDTGHEFSSPRFIVEVDGEEFEETSGVFAEVSVDRTIDGADRFSLAIAAPFDHETGRFVDFDWDAFAIGSEVTISMGYGATLEPQLVGSITEHTSDFPASGAPSITVSGYDKYHQLTKRVVNEQWEDMTDAEIVEAIAGAYGLDADPDSTGITFEKVENDKQSDAEFLEAKIAPRNAGDTGPFEVFARLDKLMFRAPNDDGEPSLELTYGESLQSFSPELTVAELPATVEVRNWDPHSKEEIVGVAEHDGGTETQTVQRAVFSEAEATRIAEAILYRARHDRIRGRGTTIGLPEIEIGEPVKLDRIGRFSGIYYVEDATHRIGANGYMTDFTVRAAAEGVAL